jgi:hypothetical protein
MVTASIADDASAAQPASTAIPAPAMAPARQQVATTESPSPAAADPVAAPPAMVATTQASEAPPIPMPRNMRPLPEPITVATTAPVDDEPLVIDESQVRRDQATADTSPGFFGPDNGTQRQTIGQDRLEGWNSGSLADYLAQNGLLDENSPPEPRVDDSYDPDGFYLDDGPNQPRRYQRRPYDDSWFF